MIYLLNFDLRMALQLLEGRELMLGLFLSGVGLVFIILGLRVFRSLVSVSFGGVGFVFGLMVPLDTPWCWLAAACGAVALGVVSARFMKASVAVLAAGWAALVTLIAVTPLGLTDEMVLVASVLAFGAVISLTFIMYYETIAAVMSFEGTLLFLSGLVVFISHQPAVWTHLRELFVDSPFFGPFAVLAGTVTGFYLQVAEMQKKEVGTSA